MFLTFSTKPLPGNLSTNIVDRKQNFRRADKNSWTETLDAKVIRTPGRAAVTFSKLQRCSSPSGTGLFRCSAQVENYNRRGRRCRNYTYDVGGFVALESAAFESTALEVTYEPPLMPNRARMPPGIVAGNAGGFALRIIRSKPSAITNVKIRN